MNGFLGFISKYGVLGINIGGILIFIFVLFNCSNLSSQKRIIQDALNRKGKKNKFNKNTKELEEEVTDEVTTPELIRGYENDFNKSCSYYQVYSQLVTLFPLFGILGTVAGLMMDLEKISNSLNTALGTTLWGLVWAIVLKFVIAILPARIIFETEAMLYDYDKKFNYTIALKNITED